MDKANKTQMTATGSMLVNPDKSSRLQAMRNRALAANGSVPPVRPKMRITANDKGLGPELMLAQELIDQRLAEILALLPAGKQRRLFKIRFGVELEQIKMLPIKRAVALLKIDHPQLTNPRGDMKWIAELTYNGEPVQ